MGKLNADRYRRKLWPTANAVDDNEKAKTSPYEGLPTYCSRVGSWLWRTNFSAHLITFKGQFSLADLLFEQGIEPVLACHTR